MKQMDHAEQIKLFTAALGSTNVVSTPEECSPYGEDRTKAFSGEARVVLLPESTADVSAVLTICHDHELPVYVRGGGTGVTGGAVPLESGIVLSMERMNRILEIDTKNMTATVEPNVITGRLHAECEKQGLLYPPDPASLDECTIGGNISENAGGPRAVKYGVTKDYVLGLEYVNARGEVGHCGGKFVKDATGYNLTALLTGSEGTLAVITKAILRLIPKPQVIKDLLLGFRTLDDAVDTVAEILQRKIVPTAIEFMEYGAISIVSRHKQGRIPFPDSKAQLLLQIDGSSIAEVDEKVRQISQIKQVDLEMVLEAENEEESAFLWSVRRGIKDAIGVFSPTYFAEDCVVPRSEIPSFAKAVKSRLDGFGVYSLLFGHAGDGNVHINILKREMKDHEWEEKKPLIKEALYKEAITHGGTISGEHGIGYLRVAYLEDAVGPTSYELMKAVKDAFDPKNILNRGKIFPA